MINEKEIDLQLPSSESPTGKLLSFNLQQQDQFPSIHHQQQRQTDVFNMNGENGEHVNHDEIHSNQSIESYHTSVAEMILPSTTIVNSSNQHCDNREEESQRNNDQTLSLKWSKLCSKPPLLRSNQFIETMIGAYRKHLADHCDPVKIDDVRDHPLNSFG
ncbi:hypothetical protein BLA29_006547 [Euroglyphus maynei]|uniref:Uncharacterized protein n=1 Tax=Euroglyphus maynei TaxID=6958 RepID=A0A1Y3AZL1_EURMA|nr:hypothetical protein BLA29_006547 [Euroglyphus maynei]